MSASMIFTNLILSLVPAIAGGLLFIALKPKTKSQQGKFDSQIINIRNGKSIEVEFTKDMSRTKINKVVRDLNHIKN